MLGTWQLLLQLHTSVFALLRPLSRVDPNAAGAKGPLPTHTESGSPLNSIRLAFAADATALDLGLR